MLFQKMVEIPDSEYQKLQSRLKELEATVTERKQKAEEVRIIRRTFRFAG